MTKNRRTLPDSRPVSDDDSEESDGNGNNNGAGAGNAQSSEPNLLAPTPVRP